MTDDDLKIYVDAGRPATLNDGAGKLTDCPTLQEAVLAWHALPSAQKIRATVKSCSSIFESTCNSDTIAHGEREHRNYQHVKNA
jgi:hypothetical protein